MWVFFCQYSVPLGARISVMDASIELAQHDIFPWFSHTLSYMPYGIFQRNDILKYTTSLMVVFCRRHSSSELP